MALEETYIKAEYAAHHTQAGGLEWRRKKCVAANTDYGVAWPQIGWKSRNSLDF
jgi:hypothetical protein